MFERQQIADRLVAQAEICEIAAALCSEKLSASKKMYSWTRAQKSWTKTQIDLAQATETCDIGRYRSV